MRNSFEATVIKQTICLPPWAIQRASTFLLKIVIVQVAEKDIHTHTHTHTLPQKNVQRTIEHILQVACARPQIKGSRELMRLIRLTKEMDFNNATSESTVALFITSLNRILEVCSSSSLQSLYAAFLKFPSILLEKAYYRRGVATALVYIDFSGKQAARRPNRVSPGKIRASNLRAARRNWPAGPGFQLGVLSKSNFPQNSLTWNVGRAYGKRKSPSYTHIHNLHAISPSSCIDYD